MKLILILRHAKSSWKETGISDHSRPLNRRGKKDAPRMGQVLFEEDLVPDIILSSTARRARDTSGMVAESSGFEGDIHYLESFYHAWPSDYLDALRNLSGDIKIAMIVGHNPGVETLLEMLTGEDERLPTAALALIQLPIDNWSQLTDGAEGELLNLWLPRTLLE
ncbi:MAG: SixA phosphatase family protein [Anaerolineales bacterium]|jgi:phosphohistidine phosphatase